MSTSRWIRKTQFELFDLLRAFRLILIAGAFVAAGLICRAFGGATALAGSVLIFLAGIVFFVGASKVYACFEHPKTTPKGDWWTTLFCGVMGFSGGFLTTMYEPPFPELPGSTSWPTLICGGLVWGALLAYTERRWGWWRW